MKVLIVEDNAPTRRVLKTTIEALGYEVTAVEDGRKGFDEWSSGEFSIVVSDWMMPEMDGLSLCRAIRGMHRQRYTSFIMVTALGGQQNYREAMEAGVDDFMTKPFDEGQLQARLMVAERVATLHQHVSTLEGLLSICSYCKKIKEGDGWKPLERYVSEHSDARFSHGVCPECFKKIVGPEMSRLGVEEL